MTPESDAMKFESEVECLLGGVTPGDFMTEVFGRRHHKAHASFWNPMDGPTAEEPLWELLGDEAKFAQLSVSVVSGPAAAPSPIEHMTDARHAFDAGYGLVLANAEKVLPPGHRLLVVSEALRDGLDLPARGITIFLSPGSVSLVPHNDGYEAFTVQLAGSKRWQLFDIVAPGIEITDPAIEMPRPRAEVVLEAGDLLYVPKGQIHRVVPEGAEPSISAALIFQPPSWLSVLEIIAHRLKDDPTFWRSVNPAETGDQLSTCKSRLVREILDLTDLDLEAALGGSIELD